MPSLADLIPLVVGVIISPLPIVAVVAMVLGERGRSAATAFTLAYTALAFVVCAVAAFASHATASATGATHGAVAGVVSAVVGVLFLALAIVNWRGRPAPGVTATEPGWLSRTRSLSLGGAALLGLGMSLTQSKNLPAEVKAGTVIAAVDHRPAFVLGMAVLFATVGSLALIVPTVMVASGSAAARQWLERLQTQLIQYNAVMMAVLFAILAAVEISHAVTAISN